MAESDVQEIPFITEEEAQESKFLLLWLDKHIGKSGECALLKTSFIIKTMNPINRLYEKNLDENDIDRIICNEKAFMVQINKIEVMFQAFEDPGKCFDTITKYSDKRIFLISSGSKGEIIVPRLVSNFPKMFGPDYPIYIFCAKMNMISTAGAGNPTNDWALDYLDQISMHDHQDDLLLRLVLDIANYLSAEGERLKKSKEFIDALKYYEWSKLMWVRYDTMEPNRNVMKGKIDEMAQRISEIKKLIRERDDAEDNDMSKQCQ